MRIKVNIFIQTPQKERRDEGEDVLISGFGTLCVKDKRERRGRNPARGNEFILEARRVVTFKCSSVVKGKLNGKGQGTIFSPCPSPKP